MKPLEGDLEHFKPILARHIERLKSQNVVYSEIMIASSEIPIDREELIGRVRGFRNWANQIENGERMENHSCQPSQLKHEK